ncbi:MAG: VCBS repeat-containing protein, partial [Candidatus Eisenbacteria bacterium]|nr:VCBS repeat-containing protein [Candidatus Eisenbacteria bacterium]
YDNDGDLDILLTGYDPLTVSLYSRVYRNDGGSFSDIVAGLVGVFAGAGSWADYDNDGDLDALISGLDEFGTSITRLYRNDAGSFVDSNAALPGLLYTKVSWADYDNDGDLDLLLAGLESASGPSVTKLFRNDAGSFTDSGIAFVDVWQASMAWGDYDSDGDLDLLLSGNNYSQPWSATKLYRNDGGAFTDVGLAVPQGARALAWGDYDNDGDLDFLLAAVNTSVYVNDGGSFAELQVGLPFLATATVAWGDFDADGDLDLALAGDTGSELLARIYENHAVPANSAPAPPSNLALSEVGDIATFSWNAGSDAETPTSGLSYNLRVGTTPGGSEVMSAMANGATGYRREPGLGNAQQRLSWSLDLGAFGSQSLYWSVQSIDASYAGSEFAPEQGSSADVHDSSAPVPDHFALLANAPNPFQYSTAIRFDLPESGLVDLAIYDVAGRRVRTLAKETYPAGSYETTWRGVDDNGRPVAAGAYFYQLRVGSRVETHGMTLLR